MRNGHRHMGLQSSEETSGPHDPFVHDGVSGNSMFMEIDQEEEEFERMLREASESQ